MLLFYFPSLLILWTGSEDRYVWKGILLAVSMLVCAFASCICLVYYGYILYICGMRLRTVVSAVIFRKVSIPYIVYLSGLVIELSSLMTLKFGHYYQARTRKHDWLTPL